MSDVELLAVDALDCRFDPVPWAFADEYRAEIAENWAKFIIGKPQNYNGRVFVQHEWQIENGIYHARYLESDYASFIGWRDLGFPGRPMRNGFAMAALRARDGAYLLGVMGDHTANPGKIYFAAGTPDRDDLLPDGRIDLAGSVLRELAEETGLTADDVQVGEGWVAVIAPPRVAFMRPVTIDLTADQARALMLERMKHLPEQELSDIHIVRSLADLDEARMPLFQLAYLKGTLG